MCKYVNQHLIVLNLYSVSVNKNLVTVLLLRKFHKNLCRYRVNQHFIVLNLCGVSINKILVTEFITWKFSQNLNLMQNVSSQAAFKQVSVFRSNRVFRINFRTQISRVDYKIFVLKYANRKITR